jgi:hypothetical protein
LALARAARTTAEQGVSPLLVFDQVLGSARRDAAAMPVG